MADQKISALTELTAPAIDDELVIVDKSDTTMAASGTDKRIKAQTLVPITAVLAADVGPISAQTTLQNITGLGLTIGASATEIWLIKYWLLVNAANITMDVKLGFATLPAGATWQGGPLSGNTSQAGGWGAVPPGTTPLATPSTTFSVGTLNGTTGVPVIATVFGGGTGGTVQIQYAQNTSDAGNLKILKGSVMEALKVAA